jgi:preprotein translocase subunit SecF
MQLLVDPKFDFIGRRKMAIIFSGALILISIGSVIIHGGPNYGIDFLGGTSMTLLFNEAPDITDVRNAVSASGYGGAEIKRFGAPNDILIRVQDTGEDDVSIPIIASLTKAFPDNPFEQRSVEKVGPKIGAELKTDAVLAVLLSCSISAGVSSLYSRSVPLSPYFMTSSSPLEYSPFCNWKLPWRSSRRSSRS